MIDSVPLIQNVAKDDINTSIIALKKEEKRLEQLIAEADAKIKELNELKVNVSDIANEVTSGNMHSVTSGAVAESLSSKVGAEIKTGGRYFDGTTWKDIYKKTYYESFSSPRRTTDLMIEGGFGNNKNVISMDGVVKLSDNAIVNLTFHGSASVSLYIAPNGDFKFYGLNNGYKIYWYRVTAYYTKTN